MDLVAVIQARGGVAPRAVLLAAGASGRALTSAVRTGRVRRIRGGWYAVATADPALLTAARLGGVVTCAWVLEAHGVWVHGADVPVHIALPRSASKPRDPRAVVHWRRGEVDRRRLRDRLPTALVQYAHCAPLEFAVAAADSALRRGAVPSATRWRLPAAVRRAVDTRAESGGESIVRQRLQRLGVAFEPQVWIDGAGRVDFLIGDRLVVEVDGFEFHGSREAFERDRRRDRALVARGFLVIRLTMRQIFEEWDRIERSVLAVVRSGRHRRRGRS